MNAIEFRDIAVKFDGRFLFKDFNLKIPKGEKVLLYGKSGSGKSTLFQLLLGFQQPDSGRVAVNGLTLDKKSVWDIRKQVAYVSQALEIGEGRVEDLLQTAFSYRANAALAPEQSTLREYLSQFELEEKILEKDLADISGGEKQRVGIIIALLLQREILLLDEITAALDGDLKKKVVDYFVEDRKWTVLAASHDSVWRDRADMTVVKL